MKTSVLKTFARRRIGEYCTPYEMHVYLLPIFYADGTIQFNGSEDKMKEQKLVCFNVDTNPTKWDVPLYADFAAGWRIVSYQTAGAGAGGKYRDVYGFLVTVLLERDPVKKPTSPKKSPKNKAL